MGLKMTDLSVLAYANNFTLWHYKTSDPTVEEEGYFNNAHDMMSTNDLIIVNTKVASFYIVAKENRRVTVATMGGSLQCPSAEPEREPIKWDEVRVGAAFLSADGTDLRHFIYRREDGSIVTTSRITQNGTTTWSVVKDFEANYRRSKDKDIDFEVPRRAD